MNIKNGNKDNSLVLAVQANDNKGVQDLLRLGIDPNSQYLEKHTILDLASSLGNVEIVKCLIDSGADVNVDMEDHERVIMGAAAGGNLAIVKALVEAGAELDIWCQGESALSYAASRGHLEVYEYLYPLTSDEDREYAESMRRKALRKKSS